MAALEAALSISCGHPSSTSSISFLFPWRLRPTNLSLFLSTSSSSSSLSVNSLNTPPRLVYHHRQRKRSFVLASAVQEIVVEQNPEVNLQKKLWLFNLPWSLTVEDIKNLIGDCGTITDAEIIKQKNGKSRGFAFVTMDTTEEAQAVIDKLQSNEVQGRVIRVEFAKSLERPSQPRPPGPPPSETRHKLYVSNLAWKLRSNNLRDFFSENFKPVSARVVFDSPTGRSAGYGFVSFATREEAEAAISALDGKELMGRPLQIKFSEKASEAATTRGEEASAEDQVEGQL